MMMQIRECLLSMLMSSRLASPIPGLNLFHSTDFQAIRAVPIHWPTIIFVISGVKTVNHESEIIINEGEGIYLPGNQVLTLSNQPCQQSGHYLAVTLSCQSHNIEQLRQFNIDSNASEHDQSEMQGGAMRDAKIPDAVFKLSAGLQLSLLQWAQAAEHNLINPHQVDLRVLDILTQLKPYSVLASRQIFQQKSWKNKLLQCIQSDVGHNWQLEDVCQKLATSPSSLRRHLQQEGTGYRETLEEARLVKGLSLLQETYLPISQIALMVGYQSQSRFGERFKLRFGLSPSGLRQTRAIEHQPAISNGIGV